MCGLSSVSWIEFGQDVVKEVVFKNYMLAVTKYTWRDNRMTVGWRSSAAAAPYGRAKFDRSHED
jgi:hypothetical protein